MEKIQEKKTVGYFNAMEFIKKREKNRCSNKKCKSVECYHENEPKKIRKKIDEYEYLL